jgi:CheY-like chemotaxis protein
MRDVLVVDDHSDSGRALARFVSIKDGMADYVESGEKALEYLQTHSPRLMFLDLMMPEMDGLEVLKKVRSNPQFEDIAVVLCSAVSDPEVQAQAISAGAQGYIVKGHYDEVTDAVKRFVG